MLLKTVLVSTSKSSNLMNKSQTESSVYDDFNKMSMQSKSDVVKLGIETLDMVMLKSSVLFK